MKRKNIFIIISIITMLFFSACAEKEQGPKKDTITDNNQNVWNFDMARICQSENGYYIFSGEFLYTLDGEEVLPLCNKAECNHTNTECNAYLRNAFESTIGYDGKNIYAAGSDGDGKFSIYKFNPDGSGSEKICAVFQTTGMAAYSISCYYQGEYLYYRLALQNKKDAEIGRENEKLYRIQLESGAEPELIYENLDENVSTYLGRMYFYKNDLYITVQKYETDGEKNTCALYRYETKSNQFEIVLDRFVSQFFILEDVLYYTSMDGIHKCRLDGTMDEVFYENPEFCDDLYYDGTYLYLSDTWFQMQQEEHSNTQSIYVLDLEGNLQKVIAIDWGCTILYGDQENLVIQNKYEQNTDTESYFVNQYYFYDKEQLKTDGNEWKSIEIKENWI